MSSGDCRNLLFMQIMQIEPLRPKFKKYLIRHSLTEKYAKQAALFCLDPKYPSLNTERLEPKEFKLYSFRINRKYRVIFYFKSSGMIEIVDINDHYQ